MGIWKSPEKRKSSRIDQAMNGQGGGERGGEERRAREGTRSQEWRTKGGGE